MTVKTRYNYTEYVASLSISELTILISALSSRGQKQRLRIAADEYNRR